MFKSTHPLGNLAEPSATHARAYRAPALEKGLDILELLAATGRTLTLSQISGQLDRSPSEIFRMIKILEDRGYVKAQPNGAGYVITDKSFSLGADRAIYKVLLACARPVMHDLADEVLQSCHLSILTGAHTVVLSSIVPDAEMTFSVRPGARQPVAASVAGAVLYAFQLDGMKAHWLEGWARSDTPGDWVSFEERARAAVAAGVCVATNGQAVDITDISAPVVLNGVAIAALTVPFVFNEGPRLDSTAFAVKSAAARIAEALRGELKGELAARR